MRMQWLPKATSSQHNAQHPPHTITIKSIIRLKFPFCPTQTDVGHFEKTPHPILCDYDESCYSWSMTKSEALFLTRVAKVLAPFAFVLYVAFTSAQAQAHPVPDTREHAPGSPIALMDKCAPKDGYPHHVIVTMPNGDVRYTGDMVIVNKAIVQETTSTDYGFTVHSFCR